MVGRLLAGRAYRLFRKESEEAKHEPAERLIVHGSHHKVGTVWFNRVLGGLARRLGWKCYVGPQSGLPEDANIFINLHSRIATSELPPFFGSHIIRDPRDVVVSGYFYHLKCDEDWCVRTREEFGGRSYQQVLQGLDREQGIEFEMRHNARSTLNQMLSWNYNHPDILEIRYEDLIRDEEVIFATLFEHYRLSPEQIEVGMDVVRHFSFNKVKARNPLDFHLRSGTSNQWRDQFTGKHIDLCKSLYGDGLIKLGYETDLNW